MVFNLVYFEIYRKTSNKVIIKQKKYIMIEKYFFKFVHVIHLKIDTTSNTSSIMKHDTNSELCFQNEI